jgi:hypothetical protein
MIEGEVLVTFDDITTRDGLHEFGKLEPSKEQDREEQRTTTTECARCIERLAIEEGSDYQTVGDNDEELGV